MLHQSISCSSMRQRTEHQGRRTVGAIAEKIIRNTREIDLGMPEILQTNRVKTPPAARQPNLNLPPRVFRAVRLSLLLI